MTATPAPAISEETQRLLATDATALDAELVEIYLAEAAEVLDSIHDHLGLLVATARRCAPSAADSTR